MEPRPVFEGRPGLDRVFRVVLVVFAVIMLAVGVVERDLRSGAAGVVVAAFVLRETFALDDRFRQALLVVLVAAGAVWLVEALA